jgi:hypothetical protein
MTGPIIDTPRGQIIVEPNMTAKLIWNPDFQPKWQDRFSRAQQFVDSEVLRLCEPNIPLLTGMLIMSGILGTVVGSGTVKWIAPYSRYQYYSPRAVGTQTGPTRGPFWFERMKQIHGPTIIASARRIAGTGSQ